MRWLVFFVFYSETDAAPCRTGHVRTRKEFVGGPFLAYYIHKALMSQEAGASFSQMRKESHGVIWL